MSAGTQQGFAKQTQATVQTQTQAPVKKKKRAKKPVVQTLASPTTTPAGDLPEAPAPKFTEPLYLRDTAHDYTKAKNYFRNPIAPYTRTNVPLPRLGNTPRLDTLLVDGKIVKSGGKELALELEEKGYVDIDSETRQPITA